MLPLRGFDPMTCSRMYCAQSRAARMNFLCQFKAVFFQTKIPILIIILENIGLFFGGLLKFI